MPAIQNIERLRRRLTRLADRYTKGGESPSVVVGYAANYGVYVHERPAKHQPGKQWKFLEQPARQLGSTLGGMVAEGVRKGVGVQRSLYLAGMRLQAESQLIVPVDTGNLRGSAFTANEEDLQSVMAAAEAKGGKIRGKELVHRAKQRNKKAVSKAKQESRKRVIELKKAIQERYKWKKNVTFHKNLRRRKRK